MQDCYHQVQFSYEGSNEDVSFAKTLFKTYTGFSMATRTKYWNINAGFASKDNTWSVTFDARYFGNIGDPEYQLLENAFP